jgi:alkylation response protein AidB-like acyl-CoA dehydrogenase
VDFELTDEQRMFQKLAKDFADREIEPIAEQIEREAKVPADMQLKLGRVGLLGITAKEKYGGLEQGFLTSILALEQIHYPCTPCTWLAASGGMAEVIEAFGTEEQKQEYIPPMIEGKVCPSTAFTEPATGLDPKMLTTTATLRDGHWVINGTKRFCTFGHLDGPSVVYCKTDGDNISAIIVPKNIPGYTCSKPWGLMGVRGLDAVDVYFRDVRVPEKNLLGQIGQGHAIPSAIMEAGGVMHAIISVACGQRALDEVIRYVKERKTRKGPISDMQGHRWLLAEMASRVEAARWLAYRAAFLREQGKNARTESAMAKLYAGEGAEWVASQALRLHGAYGYTKEYKIERIHRATLMLEIVEGTNEVQKSVIGAALVRD